MTKIPRCPVDELTLCDTLAALSAAVGLNTYILTGACRVEPLPWKRAVAVTLLHRRLGWRATQIDHLFSRAHGFTRHCLKVTRDRVDTSARARREFSTAAFAFHRLHHTHKKCS
jgi:hypothetical protein